MQQLQLEINEKIDNELSLISKLIDLDFCEKLVKYGLDTVNDFYRCDLSEEHLFVAKEMLAVDKLSKTNKSTNIYIDKKDPLFLKMWKWCAKFCLVKRMKYCYSTFAKRKGFQDSLRNKIIFEMIYRECYIHYGWNDDIKDSFLIDHIKENKNKGYDRALNDLQFAVASYYTFPWLNRNYPILWKRFGR